VKVLSDILYKVPLVETIGNMNVEISAIQFDSRKIEKGDLFVAIEGTQTDGHQYIDDVIAKGATAILCHVMPKVKAVGVTYVQVFNTNLALGIVSANFYNNPSEKLALVAITGTNGKTSTATLLYQLFLKMGYSVGLLSTVENRIIDQILPATHTTPDPISLNYILHQMVKQGCTHCFMEASSHAIHQHRIAGLRFEGAVFTNITHDHLDYHKTFDEYIKAKKALFDMLPMSAFALVNNDDKRGAVMLQNTKASKYTYALKSMTDFKAKIIDNTLQGLELDINGKSVWFKLIGEFNAYNLLAVYGTARLLQEDEDEILTVLSTLTPPAGRFQQVVSQTEIVGIVDYAHTPDALENVLNTINELRKQNTQIITVVGCGGNRDKDKRPKMANIACKLSDKVILTSDNPRKEDPNDILEEMKSGVQVVHQRKVMSVLDRREAIKIACTLAKPGDVILVAGKGHENYQEINGVKHHFDDVEELQNNYKLLGI